MNFATDVIDEEFMLSNAQHHDVVVIKHGEAISPKAFEALLQKGVRTHVCADVSETLAKLTTLSKPVLLVDAGTRADLAYNEIKRIIEQKALHAYPVVVIGKEVDAFEGVLGRYFIAAATLLYPCNINDLAKALDYAMRASAKHPPTQSSVLPPAIKLPDRSLPPPPPSTDDELPDSLTHHLYHAYHGVPQVIFDQFNKLKLFSKQLHGADYTHNVSEEDFARRGITVSGEKASGVLTNAFEVSGKWGCLHLARTAFVANQIAKALELGTQKESDVIHAALLFSCAFTYRDRNLLKYDYQHSRSTTVRKELCSKVKDSAMKVAIDAALPSAAQIISTAAKFIGREERCEDSPDSLAANVVMTAELVDRVCFASGCWNPRAAHLLLRKFKAGKGKDFHPAVMACVVKLLSEAISANPRMMLSKRERHNPNFAAEAKRWREAHVEAHEERVDINLLTPGMRLSRPLISYDGKQILSPDLLLDQDLIWRLWQLAAIRPLNGPAVVRLTNNR